MLLLEKAWAKVNGNYDNSQIGQISEAFRALTGAPVTFFNHNDDKVGQTLSTDEIWDQLLKVEQHGYVACASTNRQGVYAENDDKKAFEAEDRGIVPTTRTRS